jgi:hypothetical protein
MKKRVEYYVACKPDDENIEWWRSRRYKRVEAPKWEKLDSKEDNIDEIIKTHQYTCETWPDNDDFHISITYNVDIKKVTSEII